MQNDLREAVEKALRLLSIKTADYVLEHPSEIAHGDYATNVALAAAKQLGKNPRDLAEEIVRLLEQQNLPFLEKIEIAGPGFINFYLTRYFFKKQVAEILQQKDRWGTNSTLSGKRIMVEYTQPNPFKVFHIGHLMSNTIGEAITRLIEVSGAAVFRANYQGDVGLHIGKTLYGLETLGYSPEDIAKVGEAYVYGHEAYETDDAAKQRIIELTKKVYEEDPEIMDVYTKGREASLRHFDEIYRRLGTTFDAFFFESQTWKRGKELVEAHLGDVFEKSEGAIVYKGESDGLHTRVFINSEGLTTYEAKDLGLAFLKRETWEFDTNITVTAVEQDQYFKVVFKAIEKVDSWFCGRLINVTHGMMVLPDGKMSSRKGNVVTGESMIDEAYTAALQRMEEHSEAKAETADAIGVAALKYMILKQSVGKNVVYDLARALSFEGDSGPYLQYTYARINSVVEKATEAGMSPAVDVAPEHAYATERLLYRYPEVIQEAARLSEPHLLVTYLTELASSFNTFYAGEKIADATDEYAPYKMALAKAVGHTLKNGLWVLGIKAPERM